MVLELELDFDDGGAARVETIDKIASMEAVDGGVV